MAYENFMGNKDFHPSSFRNQRKMWEAQQKLEMEEKRQEELKLQYLKEQEMYKSKELMGKANPLNFMYEPPPGMLKDKEKQEAENSKLKFDWQRHGKSAPRESYAKNMEIQDQPFGIEVRNVKCIKCGKWGHINTDRQCPLYGQAKPDEDSKVEGPILTDWDTIDDGLRFKQCVRERVVDSNDPLQQYVHSDEEEGMVESEEQAIREMLAQFSPRQQKKILRKLAKMERAEEKDCYSARKLGSKLKRSTKKKTKKKHSQANETDSDNGHHSKRCKKRNFHHSESEDDKDQRRARDGHRANSQDRYHQTIGKRNSEQRHLPIHPSKHQNKKRYRHDRDSSFTDSDSDSHPVLAARKSTTDSRQHDKKREQISPDTDSSDTDRRSQKCHTILSSKHGKHERYLSHHHSSHHHSSHYHSSHHHSSHHHSSRTHIK